MKTFLLLSLSFATLISTAHAETRLACWNMYAKKNSKPVLTAEIQDNNVLTNLRFDFQGDDFFSGYFTNETKDAGSQWPGQQQTTLSSLENPNSAQTPSEITTNRSPYKGNNEYDFDLGTYSFQSPYMNRKGSYSVRLILPTNLSSDFLQTYRIRTASERSNAVLVIPPPYSSDQGGDSFLRMFCVSK